jgi:hypothetical protein
MRDMRNRQERRSARPALLLALVAALLVGPLGSSPALAAQQAQRPVVTQPAAGEQVARAPVRVRLVFARMLAPASSTLSVSGPGGPAGLGPARVSGRSIVVTLADGLSAGTYTATWRVGLLDGAASSGSYRFTVAPADAVAVAAPGDRGPGAWVAPAVSGLLLAGLVVAGLLAFGADRRRRRPGQPAAPLMPPALPAVPAVVADGPDPALATTLPIRVPGSTAARRIPVSRPSSAAPAWWLPRREPDEVTSPVTAAGPEAEPPPRSGLGSSA